MKVQIKIILILLPVMLFAIIMINFMFRGFFKDFLGDEEDKQIDIISRKIEFFINGQKENYQITVDDWGHWKDTFEFLNKNNNTFIENNLDIGTIGNLEVSFMIFLDKNNSIFHKIKYDHIEQDFSEFSPGFLTDFENITKSLKSRIDFSGIFLLDGEIYFLALTNVTESYQTDDTNGKLIIGRVIDDSIIAQLEGTTACEIESISIGGMKGNTGGNDNNNIITSRTANEKEPIRAILAIPNISDTNSPVNFEISKTRDLYMAGMKQFNRLFLAITSIMIVISILLYVFLGHFISRPLLNLVKNVKNINISGKEIKHIHVSGKDEIAFLQKEINSMLDGIETEQSKLRCSEEKLFATLYSVGDGVIAVDRNYKIEFLNPIAERLTGWSGSEAIGQPMEIVFNIINEYTREKTENPVEKVFDQSKIIELANHTVLISKDGTEKAIEDTAAPIRDKSGEIAGCVLVFRDSSEKREKQRRIEYLGYHDQLTDLYNRRFFDEELVRLDKKRNLPISIIYADLNGLKTMNDAFGHINGDKLIAIVANVLKTECRADDIIARVGGDEFVILLPNTDYILAEKLARRLKEKIKRKKIMNVPISVSFGCDTKTDKDQPVRDILKSAENIMYKRKTLENNSKKNLVIKSILNTLIVKSPREGYHSKRVGILCESIGKAYNLDDYEIIELKTAGELHDIGKIAVDEVILNKAGALTKSEWAHVVSHPEIGYRLLSNTHEFFNLAEYVLGHHEKWDGTGYPKALKGEAINWKSRVLAVADAYDAMTSERAYRGAMKEEDAVAELRKNAGTHFDPDIVKVFIEKVLKANK